jgi:hypothetical protein
MNLNIKKFDFNKIRIHTSICFLSSNELKTYDTYLFNKIEREIIKKCNFKNECRDFSKLENFTKSIIRDFKNINNLYLNYLEKLQHKYNSLVILDNLPIKIYRSIFFRYNVMNTKYLYTFILFKILNYQYIHPILISGIDYFFIAKEENIDKLIYIYENYCRMFPSFDIFKEVITNLKYNQYLVINNFKKSNLLEKNIYFYEIIDYKKWRIIGNKMNKVIQEHLGNPNLIGVKNRLLSEFKDLINDF